MPPPPPRLNSIGRPVSAGIVLVSAAGLVLGLWLGRRDVAARPDRELEPSQAAQPVPSAISRRTPGHGGAIDRLPLARAFAIFADAFLNANPPDFAAALARTERFREPHRSTLRGWLLGEWAGADISEALEFAGVRTALRNELLAARARTDPEDALAIALTDAAEHRGEVALVLAAAAEIDPRGAFVLALEHGIEPTKEMVAPWIAREPREALQALDAFLTGRPGIFDRYTLNSLIDRWPTEDALAAAHWLAAWQPQSAAFFTEDMQVRLLARSDPAAAFADGGDLDISWDGKQTLLRYWCQKDPGAAVAWFRENLDRFPQNAHKFAKAIAPLAAHLEADELEPLLEGLLPSQRATALRSSLQDRTGPLADQIEFAERFAGSIDCRHGDSIHQAAAKLEYGELLALAEGRQPAIRDRLLRRAALSLAKDDPQRVAEIYIDPASPHPVARAIRKDPLAELPGTIARHWLERDARAFALWLANHPAPGLERKALELAARRFAPRYLAEFVKTVEAGEDKTP